LIPLGAAALVAAVFAASSCTQDSQNVVILQADGGPVCDLAARGCGPTQACLNSICSERCAGGAACPAGTYCEGDAGIDEVCAPVQAIACSTALDCPAPQICPAGLCTSLEVLGDGGRGSCILGQFNDGCSADAICVSGVTASPSCLALPACSQDGGCPVGSNGATCNTRSDGGRLFPGKQRVCLVFVCDGTADCPVTAPHCVNGNGPLQAFCSRGIKGDFCLKATDCNNNSCGGADGSVLGTCN
jgi:hypothetical protein